MEPDYFKTLYDYNYWANARILDAAAQVSAEDYFAPQQFSFGSLHGTLVHTMSAEWMWRTRMQEGVSPPALHTTADFASLEELRAFWEAEEQQMRQMLASLSSAAFQQEVEYRNTKGQTNRQPRWQLLTHIVLHSMQHRSESAVMLTNYGHSPGMIDYIQFVRQPPV